MAAWWAELAGRPGAAQAAAAGGGRRRAVTRRPRQGRRVEPHCSNAEVPEEQRHTQFPGATPNMAAALPRLSLPLPREGGVSPRERSARRRAADMEPGGGGSGVPGPLPGNNKARGGAAPPGKARDLGRPPRKDSEVSAAATGPGSAEGGGRSSRAGRGGAGRAGAGAGAGAAAGAASSSPARGRDFPGRCLRALLSASGLTRAVLRIPLGLCFLPGRSWTSRSPPEPVLRYRSPGAGPAAPKPWPYAPAPGLCRLGGLSLPVPFGTGSTRVGTRLVSVLVPKSSSSSPSPGRFDLSGA